LATFRDDLGPQIRIKADKMVIFRNRLVTGSQNSLTRYIAVAWAAVAGGKPEGTRGSARERALGGEFPAWRVMTVREFFWRSPP
jgi:hypothetical protein